MSEPLEPTPRPRGGRLRLLKYLIALPLIALVWWFVIARLRLDLARLREGGWQSLHVGWGYLLASLVMLICARAANAVNCKLVLHAMGVRQPLRNILPIIWVASLGRYIPGKVSVVAGALVLYARLGIAMTAALASLFLSTALTILVSLLIACPLLFMPPIRDRLPHIWIAGAVVLAASAVVLHPRAFTAICNLLVVKFKRPRLPDRLEVGPFLRALATTILRIVFLGSALYLAGLGLKPVAMVQLPLFIGSAALASFAGFIAVFAPAGLGVHEGIYIVMLQAALDPLAGILAVLFRLLNIVADAIAGAIGMAMLRSHPALARRENQVSGESSTQPRPVS